MSADPNISTSSSTGPAGFQLPGPKMNIPAATAMFGMSSEEWADLMKWIDRAKKRQRVQVITGTAQVAFGVGVTSAFAFITTKFIGLDTGSGQSAVVADSWVAPLFLVAAVGGFLWAGAMKLLEREQTSTLDDALNDMQELLSRIRTRHEAGG